MARIETGTLKRSKYYLNINWGSPNVSDNFTMISWQAGLNISNGDQWYSNAIKLYSIYINGIQVFGSGIYSNKTGNGDHPLANGSLKIYHDSDGSKKNVTASLSGWLYSFGDTSGSGKFDLSTIPRATNCPSLTGDIESSYNIALNPAVSSFTHAIKVILVNEVGYINAQGNLQTSEYKFTNANINFTISPSFYNQFGGKSMIGELQITTYNGSNSVGLSTSKLIVNCLESRCRPSISAIVKDVNQITKGLTNNDNKLIKYFSNVLITPVVKASTSLLDTNCTITQKLVNGTIFTTASVTILKITKKDFAITATNSRGFSTTTVVNATGGIEEYFVPIINSNFARISQTSSQIKLTYDGSFFNQNFGNSVNMIALKWYWKSKTDANWILGGSVHPTISGNAISKAIIDCGSSYDYKTNYRFRLEVVDKLSNEGSKENDVIAGEPNFSHGKGWFQHHTQVIFDKLINARKTYIETKAIELYTNTPYIDFHFNNSPSDYTSRLIESESEMITCVKNFNISGFLTVGRTKVVESGSNTNASWTKFYDGTMIITQKMQFSSVRCDYLWGSLYTNKNDIRNLPDFPIAFVELKSINIDVFGLNGDCLRMSDSSNFYRLTNAGGFQIARGTSMTLNIEVHVQAFGKWR